MTGTTPPGWYHDGAALRWWDGNAWDPYAPPPQVDIATAGKSTAVISHLGFLACYFVLPLVIRQTAGTDNAYVRHHATEALNFMILATGIYGILWLVWVIGIIGVSATDAPFGALVAIWLLVAVSQLGTIAFGIMGAVRASQGVWWRYPISIRFVRP
jgi:uncharacterized Tic20 family protein